MTPRSPGARSRQAKKVIIYWAAANRDAGEFPEPDTFDLDRPPTATSRSAPARTGAPARTWPRMNLRIALDELLRRLHDIRLQPDADVHFHSTFNRGPRAVPITFTPGPRVGDATV